MGNVRVFIQRSKDKLFLKGKAEWGVKEKALNFRNFTFAINYCVEHGIKNVSLWVSFEDSKYDFAMLKRRRRSAISSSGFRAGRWDLNGLLEYAWVELG